MKKIALLLTLAISALAGELVTKKSDSSVEVAKTREVQEVTVYKIDDLVKEEAALHENYKKELARVRALIEKAKQASVEPSADVADVVAANEAKQAEEAKAEPVK